MPDRCGWIPMNLWKHDQNCNWLDIRGLLAIHPCVVHLILPYSFIIISLTFLYLIVLLLNFICKLCSSLSLSSFFLNLQENDMLNPLTISISDIFIFNHHCISPMRCSFDTAIFIHHYIFIFNSFLVDSLKYHIGYLQK